MKNTKFMNLLVGLLLGCVAIQAAAQESPMMTVLRHGHGAGFASEEVKLMLQGFVACQPQEALPRSILVPLGVKFLEGQGNDIQFAYPGLFTHPDLLLLAGNDPASMETTDDGRYLFYGGQYRLKEIVIASAPIALIKVGQVLSVSPPRARIGITYTFNQDSRFIVPWLESRFHVPIQSRVGHLPPSSTATSENVWYTLPDDGQSVTCWRYVN